MTTIAALWVILAVAFGMAGVAGQQDIAAIGLTTMAVLSVSVELSERRHR